MDRPKGYVEFTDKTAVLPNPLEVHVAESRWQTCNCQTCQEKRLMMDALPGKRIDWERYKKNSDWHYNAIFYLGE